jgi:hypothetical protein
MHKLQRSRRKACTCTEEEEESMHKLQRSKACTEEEEEEEDLFVFNDTIEGPRQRSRKRRRIYSMIL